MKLNRLFATFGILGMFVLLTACGNTWSGVKQDTGENLEATGEAIEGAGQSVQGAGDEVEESAQ